MSDRSGNLSPHAMPSTPLIDPQSPGRNAPGLSALDSSSGENCISALVERQATLRPSALALSFGPETFTYAELNRRANQLAHFLQKSGVGPEVFVGIYMERSAATVIAILAVLKAGGAYVPIDLGYPQERVEFMLEDAKTPVVLTEQRLAGSLPGFKGQLVCVDSDKNRIAQESELNLARTVKGENAAYVIFTSGSTGKPKGVVVTHANVVRLFTSTQHWYGFDEKDVWTLFHSFAFDFSVWELWGALFYGGRLVVVPYLISRSPEAFYKLLGREQVTVLNQTPSAFRQLIWAEQMAAQKENLKLRFVVFGGEALELQSLRPWFERHGDQSPRLINMYGITETTVHVTYRPITLRDLEKGLGSVIGKPIPDLTLHVLDEAGKQAPPGTPGEMYVGGAGVARGYLNRSELTREKFVPDPFSDREGGRLYRSGDLAKILPDGDIEYLGRIDHQVKIRGFRIELGEIENGLNSHPGVRESAVVAQEIANGEKRLVGYLVCGKVQPSIEDLRNFLGTRLPQYMIPAAFVFMDALPLTINGKVDRRALPSPDKARPGLRTEYVAPAGSEEKALAAIWEEALQIDRVGVHDNFFELGGDSIRSIQVLARAQQQGIRFSLQKLFDHPTVHQLVRMLDARSEDEIPGKIPPLALVSANDRAQLPPDIEDAYPAAKLQTGMVFHSDYDPESAIFHDVFSFRLRLPFEEATLKEAAQRLTQRHSIFRTSLDLATFSEPLQLVHREVVVPFSVEDLRALSPDEQKRTLVTWVELEKRRRFDWSQAPLMRLHAQRYSEDSFQFIVSFHHVIMDGWSLAAMLTELFQDYCALLEKREAGITAPRVSYRDFVLLEKQAIESEEVQGYWKRKLENASVHALPRWPVSLREGGLEQVRGPEIYFPDDLFTLLKNLATELGVPIRTVLLAAHCRVMSFLTGQTDMLTGLVANGRPQLLDGERLIGLFLNTLPFRIPMEGGTWKELIQQTFVAERELLPHRRAPLSEIQKWTGGRRLFETTFDFVQFHVYRDLPGYKDHSFLEDHYFEANNFTFFTTFMVDAAAAQLQMHFDYDPNELCEEQIGLMCEYYANTLRAIAHQPDGHYETHSSLPEGERIKLLRDWNQTEGSFPDNTAAALFEEQAARTPDAVAAVFAGQKLTYRELNRRANYLAQQLRKLGAKPEMRLGIYCERSLEMLIAVLAVWKTGAAYIPLDPSYPQERIDFVTSDARIDTVLTHEKLRARSAAQRTLSVDALLKEFEGSLDHDRNEPVPSSPGNLAYMIYTSGSTGKPKGVEVLQSGVVNFLESMRHEPGLQASDVLLAVTTLSFDISVLELILPLIVGARVVIADAASVLDPAALERLIETEAVTVMQATPTTWRALVESGWKGAPCLKVLCGGEALSRDLADKLNERTGELWNMYGPTETTVWSSCGKVLPGSTAVSIGKPIANTRIYVLDKQLATVPVESEGEIYIGGAGLARGYFERPELTAERFVPDPFDSKSAQRLYRTGDLGRWSADGTLFCTGRIDQQVKMRGFRIELGEIESALARHPAVAAAVASALDDDRGIKRLVAYWIPKSGLAASISELRQFLEKRLPGYMVPSCFISLAEFPLTPNGKIDRKRLPKPAEDRPELERPFVAARTPLEELLADTWKEVLKLERVGIHDNFFELGGHSLSAMQVIARLRSQLETELTVGSFFEKPTIAQFALFLMEEMLEQSGLSEQELEAASGAFEDPTALVTPIEPAKTG